MSERTTPDGHEPELLLELTNVLRQALQKNTCCPVAALQVLKVTLGTLALDAADHDIEKGAVIVEELMKEIAYSIRTGGIKVVRGPGAPSAH